MENVSAFHGHGKHLNNEKKIYKTCNQYHDEQVVRGREHTKKEKLT